MALKCKMLRCEIKTQSMLATTKICNRNMGKHIYKNILTGHSQQQSVLSKQSHPPAMKIWSLSCFPRERRGSFWWTPIYLFIEKLKLYHGWFQTCFRMLVWQFESLIKFASCLWKNTCCRETKIMSLSGIVVALICILKLSVITLEKLNKSCSWVKGPEVVEVVKMRNESVGW